MTSSLSARRHAVRHMLCLLVAAALGTAAPRAGHAQPYVGNAGQPATLLPGRTSGMVAAGDTVRLFAARVELVHGILVRVDGGAFVVKALDEPDTGTYQRERITSAEVRRGERRRGLPALAKGAAAGAVIGAGLVTLGIALDDHHSDGLAVIVSLFVGSVSFVTGTLIGGVVALTYTDLWIPFDTVTLRIVPAAP